MAAEISDITERNRREMLSERALLLEVLDRIDQIDARMGDLDADLSGLLQAWSSGGMRGLRQAAERLSRGR